MLCSLRPCFPATPIVARMAITNVTRQALVTALAAGPYWWSGVLEEHEFLGRLYSLEDLPSHDDRYEDALGDLIQHRVNNLDWDNNWVFDDSRFGLRDDDEMLLRFLAETLHPEVRTDRAEMDALLQLYNDHLRHDDWELHPLREISGRPVFGWRMARKPRPTRRQFREAIAEAIRDNLKSYDVAEFCQEELGLAAPRDSYDDPHHSKRGYVLERLKAKNEGELLVIARRVLAEFSDVALSQIVAAFDAGPGGVPGELKNLIFAADGPKPEIVFRDAINNDIEITRNAHHCLVYDRPLDDSGLSWRALVAWWATSHPGKDERTTALDLHNRLIKSVANDAERLIFATYAKFYGRYGFGMPALIPQVYLHYDPLTQRDRGSPGPLARQRMDFLLLLPKRHRVVIELDGKHHYADDSGAASPTRYADLVREDRDLRLAGYEVFRIGGAELDDRQAGTATLNAFFVRLLASHGIPLSD